MFSGLVLRLLWYGSQALFFDDHVERSELPDDSVIVVLAECKYRFKIPVDNLYDKLLKDAFLKRHRGIDRKVKKAYQGSRFNMTATYPDMTSVNLAENKPGYGNKIMISLGGGT